MNAGDESQHAATPDLSRKEILLVEDSLDDRKRYGGWLIAAGFRDLEVLEANAVLRSLK